jgi:hypothetical protein
MKRANPASMMLLILGTAGASWCWADQPIAWGAPAGAKGCVVFREYEKIDVSTSDSEMKTTAKSRFELEVANSQGYTLPKTVWPDDQGTMDELQRIATSDRIAFVKLKDHYSPADLDAAQALCRQAMTPVQ